MMHQLIPQFALLVPLPLVWAASSQPHPESCVLASAGAVSKGSLSQCESSLDALTRADIGSDDSSLLVFSRQLSSRATGANIGIADAAATAQARERAAELVGQMTKQEKHSMLAGYGWDAWDPAPGMCVGNVPAIERLGIPRLCYMDNGDGFRTYIPEQIGQVTSWPSPLAVAATWDEHAVETWASALATEFKIKGANVLLGPGLNVHRVARNGRNAEYMSGESPYLGSRLAPPFVKGVQSQHVLAVMKHFIANSQETHRDTVDSLVDERTLWEVYYPPFQAAVNAGVASAMCSYNMINGKHACSQADTLLTDLKSTMGFSGYVMSDWWATWQFSAGDGLDQEMPGSVENLDASKLFVFTSEMLETLHDSKVDDMVTRILFPMITYGLLDDPPCRGDGCNHSWYEANATSEARTSLSRNLTTSSVILLKNEGVLPLNNSMRIAVLGSACNASNDIDALEESWTASNYYVIGGSGRVIAPSVISPLQGILDHCQKVGCSVSFDLSDDVRQAHALAKQVDVAVACGGAVASEAADRKSLSVDQESFLVSLSLTLDVPLVTLTMAPGAIVMPWIDNAGAALNIFLGGAWTGTAFADVLFGKHNPSGKSPVTFPKTEGAVVAPCEGPPVCDPPECSYKCVYSEGLFVGWHGLNSEDVTFPFGHGLSYTTFEYASLGVETNFTDVKQCTNAQVCVKANIKNTGPRAGVEIAQLYLGYPEGLGEPQKVLRGFAKMDLQPLAGDVVHFPLYTRDLQIWDVDKHSWRTPNGVFSLYVGSSSLDIRLEGHFAICNGTATYKRKIKMDSPELCPE